jgi:ubiquinone/menaquinone biosynthesis C-methylase UbiE
MGLDVKISADAIERAFAPYVLQRFGADDPEWRAIVARLERKEQRRYDRFRRSELPPRDRGRVEQQYRVIWSRSLDEQLAGRPTAFEWSRGTCLARSIARKRVHQLVLLDTLEAIAPRTVLEVGCGNGFNLMLLSSHFPDIRFGGLELTEAGARAARGLLWDAALPTAAAEFFVGSIRDRLAPRRVHMVRGTGAQLPYRDRAFEVIYTILALEQMESIRDAVLKELRRVASRYVVMIEPFQELNAEGMRRHYIASNQYFDARIDTLSKFGLRPVVTYTDLPQKVLFHAGLVVAELV